MFFCLDLLSFLILVWVCLFWLLELFRCCYVGLFTLLLCCMFLVHAWLLVLLVVCWGWWVFLGCFVAGCPVCCGFIICMILIW